jgi:hypothetical protein
MPDTIELIHDANRDEISGIRLASGTILAVRGLVAGERARLNACESTISYVLTAVADAERESAVDDANDTIRDLRDELEERQSRVEELCERIAELEARA